MDWIAFFLAICWQESFFNPNAYNPKEDALGIVQIRPYVIEDCNKFLGRHYKLEDRKSVLKSFRIFRDYTTLWCERNNVKISYEHCAKIWNAGPNRKRWKYANRYWESVKQKIEVCERLTDTIWGIYVEIKKEQKK